MNATRRRIIVERSFEEPMSLERYHRLLAEEDPSCLEIRRVTYLGSYLSEDGRRMLCVYEAPDAASVRSANEAAHQPFDRVWPATALGFE